MTTIQPLTRAESSRYTETSLHADVLYSRPGMFGFNLWTGLPTPTLRNATHWFWLLSPTEQQAIVARLQATPRSVVISSRPLIDFLRTQVNMTITGPLNEHLDNNYRSLFSVSGYDFLVPRESTVAPFYVAQNFELRSAAPGLEPAMLTVNIATRATVARIVLRDVLAPEKILAEWGPRNCRVTLESIDSRGRSAAAPQLAAWPLQLDGLRQLRLYHGTNLPVIRPELQLVFLDATGRSLFEACYDDPVTASAPPARD